jgi:trehalose utilization protein
VGRGVNVKVKVGMGVKVLVSGMAVKVSVAIRLVGDEAGLSVWREAGFCPALVDPQATVAMVKTMKRSNRVFMR